MGGAFSLADGHFFVTPSTVIFWRSIIQPAFNMYVIYEKGIGGGTCAPVESISMMFFFLFLGICFVVYLLLFLKDRDGYWG